MATNDRYGASRKKRKGNAMLAPLMFVVVVVLLVFGLGLLFRVQTIEVSGASHYTAQEIIEASGVEQGDNLFFINRFSAASSILSKLPFVDNASMEREMPSTVTIKVTESRAVAYVLWQEQRWMFSSSGKLLGSAEDAELAGLIHVKNITPAAPVTGETMQVGQEESAKLSYLLEILQAMEQNGMLGSVSELDMLQVSDPVFQYTERFSVKLGGKGDTDYKLRMVLAAAQQVDPSETLLLDVSDGATVYASPD